MHPKIAKRISTNTKAHLEYQLQGKTPRLRLPEETPLVSLLANISPRHRSSILSVTIDPELGYSCAITFQTAEQLWHWLGGRNRVGEWEKLPCESISIKGFNKKLVLDDLLSASKRHPNKEYLVR